MPAPRMRRSVAALLAVSLVGGCSPGEPDSVASTPPTAPSAGPSQPAPKVAQVSVVATDLRAPWSIAFLPDGQALVTERDSGRVLRVDGDGAATEVARIGEAQARGEGGLLGIVASPDYAKDATLFLYYTTERDNRIARWKLGERPQPIVTGIPAAGRHNGGRLAFGPDGYLYAGTGDAGQGARAQDRDDLGGKILRMTRDGEPAPGNPFGTLIWSYGHRNVQGLAWDSGGHLWATEFGQNTWDEVNRIDKGKNYGWPEAEGAVGDPRFVDPVAAWPTSDASCSGAAVVDDVFVAACLRGRRLWLVPTDGENGDLAGSPVAQITGEYGRLRDAVVGPGGALWVLTSNHDGRGEPVADDDRILRVLLQKSAGSGGS